jgi:hypothetical protein
MKKPERSAARGREEWRVLVREWKASGSTAQEFASTRELSVTSLYYWSSVLKRDVPAARTAARLVPVRVMSSSFESRAELELAVGAIRMRFDTGTSPRYVAALAQALLEAASA